MTKTPGISLFSCLGLQRAHRPKHTSIVLAPPGHKVELYTYLWIIVQAKFPQLSGNVFGRIGCRTIAFHQDFIAIAVTFISLHFSITKRQHPAPGRFACFRLFQQTTVAQHLKGTFPESLVQDRRFPCQQVVGDIQS